MNNNPTGKGGWKKGESGNPRGRVARPEIAELRKAIKKVEEKEDDTLLVHFVKKAYTDNTVLIAVMRKLYPDMKWVEGGLGATVNIFLEDEEPKPSEPEKDGKDDKSGNQQNV